MSTLPVLRLKRGEDRRPRAGHLWIFANEVDVRDTPLTSFEPGSDVFVEDFRGGFLGTATVNPHSLICARIHSHARRPLDGALVRERLASALALRERLFDGPWYRLAHGEGDFLPGLVIDRFGDHVTVQPNTLAWERRADLVREALADLVHPASVLWDRSVPARLHEGLELGRDSEGPVPEEMEVPENGCVFTVSLAGGQKTGWFYDQRANRALVAPFAKDADVLDAFCYVGGFGVVAAMNGAKSVTFADASSRALEHARLNLSRNAPDCACETLCGDAFETLAKLAAEGRRFRVVSVDPPAFIKRRKDMKEGLAAYRRLQSLAVSLVEEGGVLLTSSCSHALHVDELRGAVAVACAKHGRLARLLATGLQGPDHPVHCSMPETAYLKCLLVAL